ncbi:MAG: hypothetical protein DWQ36_02925 [Acidobacteria bacterium]|nr:MAG: hypothetical protein DWQ36_02925 [Acidobacteriota bacterium]
MSRHRTRTNAIQRACLGAAALALVGVPALAAGAANANLDAPTYAGEVAGILFDNCAGCHRPGQTAPMSLLSYQEARPWAKSIARNVEDRVMPPWHATGGTAKFANDRSLSEEEIDKLVRWAKAGAPAGDLEKAPLPPRFPDSEWRLGEPDFVVTLEQVDVPADGPDVFKDLIGKAALPEDKWITAVEILPGNPRVVHHVITFGVKGFDVDPQGGWLGAWAAGTAPMVFPEGTGRLLPKGSNLVADMHYHPSGTAESDVTRIGLHFADAEPAKELTNIWVMNAGFEIPPGDPNHEVRADYVFWQDGRIMSLTPHMHYRGKDFRYVLHRADGTQETIMEVARWDFNWQTVYTLDEPVKVSRGDRLECIAHYDNSADNPANPDPTRAVTFGDESYDEMMIGFIDYIVDDGVRPKSPFEIRTEMIDAVAAEHPGEVFKISGKPPEKRGEPNSWAPLHLPRQGDGTFYVISNDTLQAAAVTDIQWSGDSFTSKVSLSGQQFDFSGEVKSDGSIETTLHLPDNDMPWTGEKV